MTENEIRIFNGKKQVKKGKKLERYLKRYFNL